MSTIGACLALFIDTDIAFAGGKMENLNSQSAQTRVVTSLDGENGIIVLYPLLLHSRLELLPSHFGISVMVLLRNWERGTCHLGNRSSIVNEH